MSKLKPPVNEKDQKTGNQKALVTLVEYGDYQCPHCGHAHPLLKRLLDERGSEFSLVFRNFPVQEIHPHALRAALAAEAAGNQGKFWQMHDLLFDNQTQFHKKDLFVDLAEQLNLNEVEFSKDLKSNAVLCKAQSDFESGVRSGVNGTPTFFINGTRVLSYDGTYESLSALVQLDSKEAIRDLRGV